MKVVKAPDSIPITEPGPILFAAGGITNCRHWQNEFAELLDGGPGVLLDPRRDEWDPDAENDEVKRQIQWEYHGLRIADAISFWFSHETLQPIALFELGGALERVQAAGSKPRIVFIGCDPGYPRRYDVACQTILAGHGGIVRSLESLALGVSHWATAF